MNFYLILGVGIFIGAFVGIFAISLYQEDRYWYFKSMARKGDDHSQSINDRMEINQAVNSMWNLFSRVCSTDHPMEIERFIEQKELILEILSDNAD